ncbi:MAG: amidohydrolase, partial [Acidobacteriota bacterium]|nr:amidohydrolase [Acidobacteriota bacterium]
MFGTVCTTFWVVALLTPFLSAQPAADLVLLNGKIWTVNAGQPTAQAVACLGSRIVAVGSTSDVQRWVGASTRVVDLGGKLMLPGFNDAHVHFFSGGLNLAGVQLRDANSEAEFRNRTRGFAEKVPKGRWILGGNWDHENWTPARLPTRQWIDAVTPDHPVFVNRLDGHMSLANSLALKLAGITRDTPDPPGGEIVRDEHGEPTGILKDAATAAVERVIPPPSDDELAIAIKAAMRYASENGVTSVQDMSASPDVLRAYQRLLRNGELQVRISAHQPLAGWKQQADVGILANFGNEKLHIGGLKGFADGSLGSTTALFFQPYSDA